MGCRLSGRGQLGAGEREMSRPELEGGVGLACGRVGGRTLYCDMGRVGRGGWP